jgi:hypothetical protein
MPQSVPACTIAPVITPFFIIAIAATSIVTAIVLQLFITTLVFVSFPIEAEINQSPVQCP